VPSVLVQNSLLKRPYTECAEWRNRVVQRIRDEEPDLVVLTSNDLDNGGMIDGAGRPIERSGHADDPLWVAGWKRTWDQLPGTKVLLQDTPWPLGWSPACLAANARDITVCRRTRTQSIVEPNRRELVAEAARVDGIRVIDPTGWFCVDLCPPVIGDTLVFKDNSHLTVAYALALTPVMTQALFPARQ
jgi:hypothetical protein